MKRSVWSLSSTDFFRVTFTFLQQNEDLWFFLVISAQAYFFKSFQNLLWKGELFSIFLAITYFQRNFVSCDFSCAWYEQRIFCKILEVQSLKRKNFQLFFYKKKIFIKIFYHKIEIFFKTQKRIFFEFSVDFFIFFRSSTDFHFNKLRDKLLTPRNKPIFPSSKPKPWTP